MKVAVIVASNRPEGILDFVVKWSIKDSSLYRLFVVEDGPQKTFGLPACVSHFAYEDIPHELNEFVPRKTSAIKSLGIYFAWIQDYDYFLVLDDDCLPSFRYPTMESLIHSHLAVLQRGARSEEYDGSCFLTVESNYARGFPDSEKTGASVPVEVSVGSWCGIPDLDGRTQMWYEQSGTPMPQGVFRSQLVGKGVSYVFSGMHVCFSRKVAPYMYFFPTNNQYFRYDDIWLGFVLKRIADWLGFALHHSGDIFVLHSRLSVSSKNHEMEGRNGGYAVNDHFYHAVKNTEATHFRTLQGLVDAIEIEADMPYFSEVLRDYLQWIERFSAAGKGPSEREPLADLTLESKGRRALNRMA